MKKFILFSVILILFLLAVNAQEQAVTELFVKANKAYSEKKYEEAANLYSTILKKEPNNAKVLYNLGNTYMRGGRIGLAIYNYRKSEQLEPRNEDLKVNLTYARELTKDKLEKKEELQFLKSFFFWIYKLNLNELLVIFLCFYFIFFGVATIKLFLQNEAIKWSFYSSLIISAIFLLSFLYKFNTQYFEKEGIVVNHEISVKSGIGDENVTLFNLHEGTEVSILDAAKDWVKIEVSKDKRGWTKALNVMRY